MHFQVWMLKSGNSLTLLYWVFFCHFILDWNSDEGRGKKSHTLQDKKGKNVSELMPFMWTGIKCKPLQQTACTTILHRNVFPVFFCRVFLSKIRCVFHHAELSLTCWWALYPQHRFQRNMVIFPRDCTNSKIWVLHFKKRFCWALKAVLV